MLLLLRFEKDLLISAYMLMRLLAFPHWSNFSRISIKVRLKKLLKFSRNEMSDSKLWPERMRECWRGWLAHAKSQFQFGKWWISPGEKWWWNNSVEKLCERNLEGNMQFNMRKLFSENKTKNVVAFVYIVVRSGSELIHNVCSTLWKCSDIMVAIALLNENTNAK